MDSVKRGAWVGQHGLSGVFRPGQGPADSTGTCLRLPGPRLCRFSRSHACAGDGKRRFSLELVRFLLARLLLDWIQIFKYRSEERRVGEEGRSRWVPYHSKKK